MKTYSIFCDDDEGHPQHTEVGYFSTEGAALTHLNEMVLEAGRVELWCEGSLIHRLYRHRFPSVQERADAAAEARRLFLDADRERSATHFDFSESTTLRTVRPVTTGTLDFRDGASLVASYLPTTWLPMERALPRQ
jgi:hypothetical protein